MKLGFGEIVYQDVEGFRIRHKWDLMIYTGMMRRELRNCFIFKDIKKLSLFKSDRSKIKGNCRYRIRNRNSVRVKIRIEVNYGCKGFFVAGNIGNRKQKEFVTL